MFVLQMFKLKDRKEYSFILIYDAINYLAVTTDNDCMYVDNE